MTTKKLYTVIIFSENTVGLLNQITIIFTRRQLNIETLSVSPSAIQGIHKFTITTFADEDMIDKVVKQIDKRVDILKAYYNTDEDLVFQEIALYKLSTELFIKYYVSSFRSKCYSYCICKFIYTSFKCCSCFCAIFNFFCHDKMTSYLY